MAPMRNLRLRLWFALLPASLACAACGGGSKDSLEKRVTSLQEELTALQNQHDRLADRLQALETRAQQAAPSRAPAKDADEEERLSRPPLKVVKLEPGSEARPSAEPDEAVAPDEKDSGPRPVIREYGKPASPAKAPAPGWRAVSSGLSQDQPGSPHPKGPDR